MTGARRRGTVAGFSILVVLTGCGDGDAGDAQPATAGTAFVEGAFDELPAFRGATPIQRPTEQDGVTAASFETVTARPDTVMAFYREQLERLGWTEIEPPSEVGRDVWQGDWTRSGRRLEVSTSPLPSDDGTRTQIDLLLHDDPA